MLFNRWLITVMVALGLVACGGGGGNARAPAAAASSASTATPATTVQIIPSSSAAINADGVSTKVLTLTALDAGSGLVKGATINLSSTGGLILSSSLVTTDATTGLATVTVRANSSDQSNRTAIVSATCATCTATASVQVPVVGAVLTLTSSNGLNISQVNNATVMTATVKDAFGNLITGANVTFAVTGSNPNPASTSAVLTVSQTVVTTNLGVATASVSGITSGTATVMVTVLGAAQHLDFTVVANSNPLAITSPINNSTSVAGTPVAIQVNVPTSSTAVSFASTLGTISNINYSAHAATATALLTINSAGTATITVSDSANNSSTVRVYVTPATADKLYLSASTTTLGLATATSTPTARIIARAVNTGTGSDQNVAGQPIVFSMSSGPNGGEYLTPAMSYTNAAGEAYADFYSGTSGTGGYPIVINARIANTTVVPSAPVNITVGGNAMSVAIGVASTLISNSDNTLYTLKTSVQVTDSNNNPVTGKLVTLKVTPIAFNPGYACSPSPGFSQAYCSEDLNGNGSLDAGEDGVRILKLVGDTGTCVGSSGASTGSTDGLLTPQNSMGGAVPPTVTTDTNGSATFDYTYLKAASIWTVVKITATVASFGTESSSSYIFRLPALEADANPPSVCHIPDSPYAF